MFLYFILFGNNLNIKSISIIYSNFQRNNIQAEPQILTDPPEIGERQSVFPEFPRTLRAALRPQAALPGSLKLQHFQEESALVKTCCFEFPQLGLCLTFYSRWVSRIHLVVDFAIHWHELAMGIHVSVILNPRPTSLPIPSLRGISVHRHWVPCFMHGTWTGDLFHIW